MPRKIVNLVFGRLAAYVLRDALQQRCQDEDVLAFPDDLSVGPINPLDGKTRRQWIQENFYPRPEDWGIFPSKLDNFFDRINSEYSKIICWVCPNSIYEYCGFCECVRRTGGDGLYYIDTMDAVQFEKAANSAESCPPRLAHISPAVASRLSGQEVFVSAPLRAERLPIWQKLCTENAPLRSIGPKGAESVAISHFDPFLLTFAETVWRPAQWIVTRAAVEANSENFFRVDMMTLTGRLRALIQDGRLQGDKDVADSAMNVRLR